jgi:hypothetical protein
MENGAAHLAHGLIPPQPVRHLQYLCHATDFTTGGWHDRAYDSETFIRKRPDHRHLKSLLAYFVPSGQFSNVQGPCPAPQFAYIHEKRAQENQRPTVSPTKR